MMLMELLKTLILIVPMLLSIAFLTLTERKLLSLMGNRQGPNKVSILGILQPVSDAVKLSNKSINSSLQFINLIYYSSPFLLIVLSLSLWTILSWKGNMIPWKFSFLIFMFILAISAMKSILSAWSIKTKYPLIGSMRTVSQMVSYESVLFLILLNMILSNFSFNMKNILNFEYYNLWLFFPLIFMIWMPSILAELNRTPYDFSESESELVSGFNTELGSKSFTLIFLGEYSNILFFMMITSYLFTFNNNMIMMVTMMLIFSFWVMWIRSTLPRLRYDKFMMMAWKTYIPLMTFMLMVFITEMM